MANESDDHTKALETFGALCMAAAAQRPKSKRPLPQRQRELKPHPYFSASSRWRRVVPGEESIAQVAARLEAMLVELRTPEPQPAEEQWLTTVQAAQRLQLDRSTLDAMVDRAPKDLPGAPARVGGGKQRRHLRWPAARLEEWLAAYRAWESSRGRPPKRR